MTEIGLADLARRREVDTRSLRLPGIVARPLSESGHGSAFMSQLCHKARVGEPYICPVSRKATAWWMSLETCVANLIHAAVLDSSRLSASRTWQLPVLQASVEGVVAALGRRFGEESISRFSFVPEAAIEDLFGRLPPLETPHAEAVGFVRDHDTDALVRNIFMDM
jgi:nucleoside-diphosphate-sugar epimerase